MSRPPMSGVPLPSCDGGPPIPMPGIGPPGPIPGGPPGFSGCLPSSSPRIAAAAASSRFARRRRKTAHVMSPRKAIAAPMPMPAFAPVLSSGEPVPGVTGIGVALEVGFVSLSAGRDEEVVELGGEVDVREAALLADDAGLVVDEAAVDDEDGVLPWISKANE